MTNNVDGLLQKIDAVVTDLTRPKWRAPVRFEYAEAPKTPAAEAAGLLEYGRVLGRHKGILALVVAVCTLTGVLVSLPQEKVYQAYATLEIQGINENFLNLRDVDPTAGGGNVPAEVYLETQLKILQSETLVDRVVAKLGLENRPEFGGRQPGRLDHWLRKLGLRSAVQAPRLEARKKALENLKVRQARTSRIVEVVFDSTDPRVAADFANALAEEYIQQNVEVRWRSTQRTGEWLTRQLDDMKTKLTEAERRLQSYAQESDLVFTGERDNAASAKLRQIQEELSRAQADRVSRQSRYEMAAVAPPESLPEVLDSTILRDYEMRLLELKRQLAELRPSYKPAHYRVQRLESQAAELESALARERKNILDRVGNEYRSALRRESLLAAAYQGQTGKVSSQAAKSIHYDTLRREVDANRQLYESMLQKVKEAGIASAMKATNVRVVDEATPPAEPYKPNVPLNAGLGLLSGTCLGIVAVFLRERAERVRESGDRSIKGPGDLAYLQVPELGVIPADIIDLEPEGRPSVKRYLPLGNNGGQGRIELAAERQPSLVAESFRAALTSILMTTQGARRSHAMVVTSPAPSEGKTTAVSNLAITLAQIRARVLIVDADMRKPRMHDVFGLSNEWGLSSLLQAPTPWSEYPAGSLGLETRIPGLSVLPAGPETKHLLNLLYSPRLAELLKRLRQEYHMVLIDTPPMLHLSDARIIARLADSVILVLRAGQTTHDAALAARQRFAEDGTPVLGTILNNWDPATTGDRYGDGYYARYYEASRVKA